MTMADQEPREESRIEAAKAGRRFYLGTKCKKCGCAVRYTSNARCVPCAKDLAKKQDDYIRGLLKAATDQAAR